MTIKKLPVNIPPIIGRLHNTYPLIVMLNNEDCLPWFYSNYIQLYCNKKLNYNSNINLGLYDPNSNLDFKFYLPDDVEWRFDYTCLEIQVINIKAFPRCNIKPIDFLLDCIDQEYYIKIDLDDFYIPYKYEYNKQHMRHLNFIFGYDDNNKLFYTVGYDQNQNFIESRVPFKAIKKGYEEVENAYIKTYHKKGPITNNIYLLKKRKEINYKFDLNNVAEQLSDYINSVNTSERYRSIVKPEENSIFGLKVYERIVDYFKDLLDEKVINDVRTLHILYEHKQCMCMRIKYMQDNGYIDNEPSLYSDYCNIRQKVLIQRNMHIKYLLTNDKELIDQIISSLNEVVLLEKTILQCLYNKVKERL